jgi:hypothetical protein
MTRIDPQIWTVGYALAGISQIAKIWAFGVRRSGRALRLVGR